LGLALMPIAWRQVPEVAPEFRDMSGGLVLVGPQDHRRGIVSDLDVCFAEALAYTATLTPGVYTTFRRHLDSSWIDEALATTGTATLRK
jgi:hypothetical protein